MLNKTAEQNSIGHNHSRAKFPQRKTGQHVVMVNTKEIKKNKYDLSISRYKAVEHKIVEYEKPEAIMEKIW